MLGAGKLQEWKQWAFCCQGQSASGLPFRPGGLDRHPGVSPDLVCTPNCDTIPFGFECGSGRVWEGQGV
jgi:hypothetical protein